MIQTYQGYFQEDGQFVSDSPLIQIPIRRRTIINILDEEIIEPNKTEAQKQNEALRHLSANLKKIDDEPFDTEFDEIMKRGFVLRELDL